MLHPPAVQLVAPPGVMIPDVVGPLAEAGFVTLRFGDSPPVHPAAFAVLADAVEEPALFTRKLRATEPGVPILWLMSKESAGLAVVGLDAGADACLLRPVSGALLVAQLRALIRARTVTATADELRDLTGRLQRLYEQTEQDAALASRLAVLHPRTVADSAGWRFGVVGGVDEMTLAGGRGVILLDVAGLSSVGGAVVAGGVGRALARAVIAHGPAQALTLVNRDTRAIGLPDTAVLSATVVAFPEDVGPVRVATAGFPAPVLVKPAAPAEVWTGSGPFLGSTDTTYTDRLTELAPGEKLILLGRGAADRRPDVREIADAHRQLTAQPLADALAAELGTEEPVTLFVAERRAVE